MSANNLWARAGSASAVLAFLLTSQHQAFGEREQERPLPPDEIQCPEGSTSPDLFSVWYRRAIRLNLEAFEAEHRHPPAEGELAPLLPELIEANMRVLCDCPSRRQAAGRVPNATTLFIDGRSPEDRRFEVEVAFQAVPSGVACSEGQARPVAVRGLNRGGFFWCSGPENPELLIKLLDGCAVNGHFWAVWSAASGVELTVTVTDTRRGDRKVFVVRDAAAPETDMEAFACE